MPGKCISGHVACTRNPSGRRRNRIIVVVAVAVQEGRQQETRREREVEEIVDDGYQRTFSPETRDMMGNLFRHSLLNLLVEIVGRRRQ